MYRRRLAKGIASWESHPELVARSAEDRGNDCLLMIDAIVGFLRNDRARNLEGFLLQGLKIQEA